MSEYIRVSVGEAHDVDVEIPQWLLNADDADRSKTRAYVDGLSRALIEDVPHGERLAFVAPTEPPAPIVVEPSPFADEED